MIKIHQILVNRLPLSSKDLSHLIFDCWEQVNHIFKTNHFLLK